MKFNLKPLGLASLVVSLPALFLFITDGKSVPENNIISYVKNLPAQGESSIEVKLKTPAPAKILQNSYYISQHFNNCGPASLSMALSYYGINKSQEELGEALRPYQIPSGDNDDKSVTLDELASESKKYGLASYHLPNGNIEKIKLFISYNIPVITRTWLHVDDDIGHYRVVKGYNDITSEIIQDDSYEGKDLRFSYSDFDQLWKKFNYEFLVLIPEEKLKIAQAILEEDVDPKIAWQKAVKLSQEELVNNPDDKYVRFNLSVAYYNVGEYQKSTEEFEKVEYQMPFRTLWYQIEPIKAYYELGKFDRVFEITDRVLNNYNLAFSELYMIRGNIYLKQGNRQTARSEFEQAVFFNKNMKDAQTALLSVQ